ncbi:Uu.00g015260.m01.CDS01 [Anthostomella pinea]|uniref:Uu.00g015260.m01.CDS01 n=1 Tax=Anthostomella pinea TaxID=933095 RepID=A0AAI8VYI8_9PEZI|nr:Uu.00g015260.m01.CDS01 [Anthostomella pinea]
MAEYDVSPGNNFGHLLQTIGSWGRPSMFRSMIVASSTAALLGLGAAVGSGILLSSGSFGFLVGSCIGFVGASIHYYNASLSQALVALEEHPRLMQLHLAYNFPWLGFQRLSRAQLHAEWWRHSWIRQGNLIAAWQSASGALDEIHDRRTQLLVDRTVKQGLESGSGGVVLEEDTEGGDGREGVALLEEKSRE